MNAAQEPVPDDRLDEIGRQVFFRQAEKIQARLDACTDFADPELIRRQALLGSVLLRHWCAAVRLLRSA